MKVLVCGGRNYKDRDRVFDVLDEIDYDRPIHCVVQGGASGADRYARQWASHKEILQDTFMADWMRYGPAAGPMRNQHMLNTSKPDLVIAFPGGTGTADMTRRAKAAGVELMEIT